MRTADGVSTGQSTVRLLTQSVHFITQTGSNNYKLHAHSPIHHGVYTHDPAFLHTTCSFRVTSDAADRNAN